MFNRDSLNHLYRYAYSLTRDEDMAHDLLQSSLERGLNNDISSMKQPMAYLKTIVRNLFFDLERRRKVVPIISIDNNDENYTEQASEITLEDLYIQQDEAGLLIEKLTSAESELLYLWAVEEYTADEIGKIYNQSRNTVLSKLSRLKKRIRSEYSDMATSELQAQQ